jgi:GalNAc-alpha-(1->4)-GalNAc-alpha-(1->3)-diNAcBac-PP-undecaprenol alpha-1,4-N-acetyl-D-galactosaminyltransferase
VIPSLAPGGAERVLSVLANEWAGRGHDVLLATLAPTADDFFTLDERIARRGIDLNMRPKGLRWLTVNLERVRRLRRLLASFGPDVVVSFLDATNLLTLMASRGLNAPVVVSVRTNPITHAIKPSHKLLRRRLYPRADAVVVQTSDVADWVQAFVADGKVVAIPNPVAPPPTGEHPEREQNVAAVGRLDHEKGFDLLLEAFARCAPSHPGWSLTIAGSGPDASALAGRTRALGLQDRVDFLGVIPEPHMLFARSSLFVLPSRAEGFPNVLLEAMAAGLPVVATDCHFGPRTIVRDGIDGLLVPPDDPEALAAAMGRLMADEAERDRLAREAPAVLERFGLSLVADRWDELFSGLVD